MIRNGQSRLKLDSKVNDNEPFAVEVPKVNTENPLAAEKPKEPSVEKPVPAVPKAGSTGGGGGFSAGGG